MFPGNILGHLPEPRLVVDDVDKSFRIKSVEKLLRLAIVSEPFGEMNEYADKFFCAFGSIGIFFNTFFRNHVDFSNPTQVQLTDHSENALLSNIFMRARNAQRWSNKLLLLLLTIILFLTSCSHSCHYYCSID